MPENIHEAGFEFSIEEIDPATIQPSMQSFAPFSERQGLFIHTFKCEACSLEFAGFSWWPDRHAVVNTACPECQQVTRKMHFMSTVTAEPGQGFGAGPEIYQFSPAGPNPQLMADCSTFPGLPEDEPGTV